MHGWLNIDKPEGFSSHQAVGKVRRILGIAKVGHAGTLDPLATGILPIAVGEATKTIPFMVDQGKVYQFTVQWGVQTTTDDREGESLSTSGHRPSGEQILEALPHFIGVIEQVPPKYSAIKIQGKPAYSYARSGKDIKLQPRLVQIDSLKLLEQPDQNHATFEVACQKGTYVRSLARDLAIFLGTVGHVTKLRRTSVGKFHEDNAISLEKFEDLGHKEEIEGQMHPLQVVLDDILAIPLSLSESHKLWHGQAVQSAVVSQQNSRSQDLVFCTTLEGVPVAIAALIDGWIRPKRIFNIAKER